MIIYTWCGSGFRLIDSTGLLLSGDWYLVSIRGGFIRSEVSSERFLKLGSLFMFVYIMDRRKRVKVFKMQQTF